MLEHEMPAPGVLNITVPVGTADGSSPYEKMQDSKLRDVVVERLANSLCFDEIADLWYRRTDEIWIPTTKTGKSRLVDDLLSELLPEGFSDRRFRAVERLLENRLGMTGWEQSPDLLPVKNGVLNVKTRELAPYSAKHRFNWRLPYSFDPDAKINVIRRWLWDASGQDEEVVSMVRAFFKIAVTGGTAQKFLEVIGPGGTGKSTLVRLLVLLLGEKNHAATDLKNLEQNRFEAATLYGKRLAVISDSSRFNGEVSVLKALTGGDPIRHERKHQQQSGSFTFRGVVVIAANEPIQSTDYTSGLARRRLPVYFNRKITDADKAKWRSVGGIEKAMEAELPGLLNWVLSMPDDEFDGVIQSISGDLNASQRQHLTETNKLAAWIDDRLVADANAVLYVGPSLKSVDAMEYGYAINRKLYPNYQDWCEENGVQAISVNRFANSLIDVCQHCRIPVNALKKDRFGKRIQGLAIRQTNDFRSLTPVTQVLLDES